MNKFMGVTIMDAIKRMRCNASGESALKFVADVGLDGGWIYFACGSWRSR